MNKKLLGILLMTLGMFCLSVNDMTYKNLTINFPVWEAIFFRAFSGSIISIFLVYRLGIGSLKTKKPKLCISNKPNIQEKIIAGIMM